MGQKPVRKTENSGYAEDVEAIGWKPAIIPLLHPPNQLRSSPTGD